MLNPCANTYNIHTHPFIQHLGTWVWKSMHFYIIIEKQVTRNRMWKKSKIKSTESMKRIKKVRRIEKWKKTEDLHRTIYYLSRNRCFRLKRHSIWMFFGRWNVCCFLLLLLEIKGNCFRHIRNSRKGLCYQHQITWLLVLFGKRECK